MWKKKEKIACGNTLVQKKYVPRSNNIFQALKMILPQPQVCHPLCYDTIKVSAILKWLCCSIWWWIKIQVQDMTKVQQTWIDTVSTRALLRSSVTCDHWNPVHFTYNVQIFICFWHVIKEPVTTDSSLNFTSLWFGHMMVWKMQAGIFVVTFQEPTMRIQSVVCILMVCSWEVMIL